MKPTLDYQAGRVRRCPGCGCSPFDPRAEQCQHCGRRKAAVALSAALNQRAPRDILVGCVILALPAIWASGLPGQPFWWVSTSILLLFLALAITFAARSIDLYRRVRAGEAPGPGSSLRSWLMVVVILQAVLLTGLTDTATFIDFTLSRPALSREYARATQGQFNYSPHWVGLFHADRIFRRSTDFTLIILDQPPNSIGLTYDPTFYYYYPTGHHWYINRD